MLRVMVAVCLVVSPFAALARSTPSPWFGTWKLRLNSVSEKPETLVYSDAGGGAMRMVSIEDGSVIVTRFDGAPSANVGKGGSREPVLAVKAITPTKYAWTFYRAGQPYVEGVNALAPDRKTFIEKSWAVGKPDNVFTLIYDRQP